MWWWKTKHIRGHLWHRYSAMVNQVMVATVKLSKWWLQFKRARRGRDRCLSPLMLSVRILVRTRCTTLCDKVCQWLSAGRWFSLVSPTNKTGRHNWNIVESCAKHHNTNKTKQSTSWAMIYQCVIFLSPSHSFLSVKTNSSMIILENCILIW